MKYMQVAAFVILTLSAFGLTLQAQNSFMYKGESVSQGNSRESITVIITKGTTGYVVSGEYISDITRCKIQGSYFPVGRRLRATCIYGNTNSPARDMTVTGFKFAEKEKDGFQISVGDKHYGSTMVAYLNGIKPKGDTTGGTSTSGGCTLAGLWKQATPSIAETEWNITADGTAKERGGGYAEGKATLNGNVLRIDWSTKTGYSGYYKWTLDSNCVSVEGNLQFEKPRTDKWKSSVRKS